MGKRSRLRRGDRRALAIHEIAVVARSYQQTQRCIAIATIIFALIYAVGWILVREILGQLVLQWPHMQPGRYNRGAPPRFTTVAESTPTIMWILAGLLFLVVFGEIISVIRARKRQGLAVRSIAGAVSYGAAGAIMMGVYTIGVLLMPTSLFPTTLLGLGAIGGSVFFSIFLDGVADNRANFALDRSRTRGEP